jgi:hypothetical protein
METVESNQGEHQVVNGEQDASNSFVRLLIVAGQTYSAEQSRYVLSLINSSMCFFAFFSSHSLSFFPSG